VKPNGTFSHLNVAIVLSFLCLAARLHYDLNLYLKTDLGETIEIGYSAFLAKHDNRAQSLKAQVTFLFACEDASSAKREAARSPW